VARQTTTGADEEVGRDESGDVAVGVVDELGCSSEQIDNPADHPERFGLRIYHSVASDDSQSIIPDEQSEQAEITGDAALCFRKLDGFSRKVESLVRLCRSLSGMGPKSILVRLNELIDKPGETSEMEMSLLLCSIAIRINKVWKVAKTV